MPRIVIKGKDLPRAQFLNSQIPQYQGPYAPGVGPYATTTTTKPPIPYAAAVNNPNDVGNTDPFSSNFSAKDWTKQLYTKTPPPKENKPNFFDKLGAWGNRTEQNLNRFYNALDPIHTLLGAFDLEKKRRNSEKAARLGYLPDNRYAVTQQTAPDIRGGYNVNTGGYGQQGDYTVNQGQLTNATGFMPQRSFYNQSKMGGEQGPLKIRITRTPDENIMAYGGQARHSLDLRRDALVTPNISYENPYEVTDTLKAVPRDEANVEAEKGETVFGDLDGDGGLEHMKIGGKRHHEGGTPLNLPTGAFIYSDTQKMSIKDEQVLAYFSLKPKKGGYTPAEIAKRYDINKYKAMLEDPEADDLKKSTAQQMITAYNKKLAYLALIQESMKGFPQGIPEVAKEILGIEAPEEEMQQEEGEEQDMEQGEEMPSQNEMMEQESYQYGGGADLEKFQNAGQVTSDPNYQYKARTPGKLDWSSVGYAGGIWSGDRYQNEWTPLVQQTLGDPNRASQVLQNLENYTGPDAADVQKIVRQAKATGNPNATLMRLATDKKVGPFHRAIYNAMQSPPPQPTPTTTVAPVTTPTTTQPYFGPNQLPEGKTSRVPFAPLKPDVLNRTAAGLFPPKNYQIPIMKPAFTPERVKLYDPRQALAENQSLYNTTMGALGSMGDVRTLNSMAGGLQGKSFASAASVVGDYQDKNVGVVNPVLARNAEAQRQYDREAADLATQTGFVNRDTDVFNRNQWRQYVKGIRAADTALWNNAVKMGLMNATNKYNIDPWTGQVTMKPGTPGSFASGYTDGYGTGAHFQKMQKEFPGLTYDQYFSPKMQSAFKKSDESDPMLPYLMSGAFAGPYGSS
jgi:hypothetical protein